MYGVEVVPMSLCHLDEVMIVEKLSFRIPWSRESFVDELTRNKFAVYMAALIDDRAVGYAGMWKVCDEGHITNIAVHPDFRGRGIGSKLMEKLLDIARQEGITSMTLEVRRTNAVAQALYSKYGFAVEGVRKAYYADNGEDALIMWKNNI